LSSLLTERGGLAELLETVLNQVLETQLTEQIGAERYERSEARQLYPRVYPLRLQMPQVRDGRFSTEIFRRYRRSEQAFVPALMGRYIESAQKL
jgi:transposase-like protein